MPFAAASSPEKVRPKDPGAARSGGRAPYSLVLLAHLHARAMLVVFPRAPGHPFEPEDLGRYWPSSPTAPKLLARQQGPRRCLPGHRYAASNRAGLRCVVSPCPRLRPCRVRSRGGWDTPLGGVRVSETATSVGLAIFVYYPLPGCAPRARKYRAAGSAHKSAPKVCNRGFGRRMPEASACCRASDSCVLQRGRSPRSDPAGLHADSADANLWAARTDPQTRAPSLRCVHAAL